MITVLKEDGTEEEFSEEKLLTGIRRAGIPKNLQEELVSHVKQRLYDRIPTHEIYRHVGEYLGKSEPIFQAKYSLKRAIMEIGPTGFPFEIYISEVLKALGYETEVGVILRGKCVNHEVDVIAKKPDKKVFVECKYHNKPGIRSDVHVALYTKARFDDLKAKHNFSEALLVTNTKITTDALDYANCENINVIGWNYPESEGLRDLVEKYKLFPITQFPIISFSEKTKLLEKNIVLAKQICQNPSILNDVEIDPNKKEKIIKEAELICSL